MTFSDIEVSSISELLKQAGKLEKTDAWIFRGMHNSEYELQPSVGRIRHDSIRNKLTAYRERRYLWQFRDWVRPHVSLTIANELEWLVLGQHHGLPTRLLDWTRSPIVAAYFAVKTIEVSVILNAAGSASKRKPIDGTIYAVPRPPKVSARDRTYPFKIARVKLVDPPHISERVPRQVGVLTLHPDPREPWTPKGAIRFNVPNAAKMNMKNELLGLWAQPLF